MNPFLFLLSLVAGFVLSWYLIVRKVVREVPGAVGVRSGYGSVPTGSGHRPDAAGVDDRSDAVGAVRDDRAYRDDAPGEPTPPVSVAEPGDWAARLEHAKDLLVGGAVRLQHDLSERIDDARTLLLGHPGDDDVTDTEPEPTAQSAPTAPAAPAAVTPLGRRGSGATAYRSPTEASEELESTQAMPSPAEEPEVTAPRRLSDWAEAPADGRAPDGYAVKGDQKARLYLMPDDPDFDRARPDIWFLDETAALDAGYARYIRRAKGESRHATQDSLPTADDAD
jgi:hypothetical protein